MTLDQFEARLRGEVDTFFQQWREEAAKEEAVRNGMDPIFWPTELADESDWFEQFLHRVTG